jgi:predicted Zn-dependent protease
MPPRPDVNQLDALDMVTMLRSANSEGLRVFKNGVKMLRGNAPHSALVYFRKAVEQEPHNPYYISFLGVALARAEGKWQEAEKLCQEALRIRRQQPQLYANLAEVYLRACRRDQAVDALLEGLHYSPSDLRLNRMLAELGVRREPVLSFLPRNHLLNRGLGRLRHRLFHLLHRRPEE